MMYVPIFPVFLSYIFLFIQFFSISIYSGFDKEGWYLILFNIVNIPFGYPAT